VGFGLHSLHVNAWQGRYATPSGVVGRGLQCREDALAFGTRLADIDPAWTTSHRQHIDTLTCLPQSYTIPIALDLDKRLCMFLSRTHKKE
jgi:hypothetical protein